MALPPRASESPESDVPGSSGPSAAPTELLYRIVEAVTDYAIFALDPAGRVLTWNHGAQRLKGYTPQEILGRSFEVFYPRESVESGFPRYELEVAGRDGRFEDYGWRLRKDGSRFWAHVVITALRDDRGELIAYGKVTSDETDRREAAESLRESEERLRLLIDSVQDYAILTLDPSGRVSSWNHGAERLKGYTPDEIIGRSFDVFYPPEAVASGFPRKELEAAARTGRFEDEGWRVRKDGSRFWANVIIAPLRGAGGTIVGFAKITRDLTARREAEQQARALAAEHAAREEAARRSEELQQLNLQLSAALDETRRAREAAEEAYRELDQFAYVASHDLKAPLRGIASLASWIEEDAGAALTAETAEHIRLLQIRVHRMQGLIDGILAYSRAGRRLTPAEVVDTATVLRDAIDLVAAPEGVRIEIAGRLPVITAERVPLQQVFLNLIGNAVKYGRAARPDVVITVGCRDLGDLVEFSVTDNGPGIPPEYHERIWGLFQTLEARDKVEGTGIGLAVVKKIVESRGGAVVLESAPGEGATFRFTWRKSPAHSSR